MPPSSSESRRSPVLPALWVLGAIALVQLWFFFDWGEGRMRAGIAVALAGWLVAGNRWLKRFQLPPWLTAIAIGLVGIHAAIHIYFPAVSIAVDRQTEMGMINARAVALLPRGVNPWGRGTLLDPGRYMELVATPEHAACLEGAPGDAEGHLRTFWTTLDTSEMARAMALPSERPGCEATRRAFESSGLKYGPAMVLSYLPLALPLGHRGIYATHLLLTLGGCAALWRWQRARGTPAALACVPLLVMLGPNLLRFDALRHSDCDLFPTFAAVAAVLLWEAKRPALGGLALGVSISAKLLPGALLVPLLFGRSWRAAASTLATVVLFHLPFLLWDARGLWENLVAFNLGRPTDSTALAHFVPPVARLLLTIGFCAVAGVLSLRGIRRRWPLDAMLGHAVGVLLALFVAAKIFHNNYTLWLLPFLGLWMGRKLDSLWRREV